jgi:AraC-like DNA-binding protein
VRWDRASQSSRELPEGPCAAMRALLDIVAPDAGAPAVARRHPAVMRTCALLDDTAAAREIRMTQLARQAGLSLRQLRHLFTQELGINPCLLRWRRLRRAG